MVALYFIFWISLGIIFYNYLGYGMILWIINKVKAFFVRRNKGDGMTLKEAEELPRVTLVVAAYNEADIIEDKIKDCFQLDYPGDKLDFLFITDGSDDETPEIVAKYPQIRLLHHPARSGKTAALNRAMTYVNTPITVFCDANTLLCREALLQIITHYRDSNTGGVSGEKRVMAEGHKTAAANESLYWKYESFLKRLDAQLYTVVGAAGELFSIRTALWEPLEEHVILDDFVISLRMNLKGYRMAYEPLAYAMELPSASLAEEKKRKVRISAGAFQAMELVKPVFNFFKHPVLFFQFFSHRFLRWTVTPLCIPLLFLSNLLLVIFGPEGVFFSSFLSLQTIFYLLAALGAGRGEKRGIFKVGKICQYILFMNFSVYLGFFRYLKGSHSVLWQKARREVLVNKTFG